MDEFMNDVQDISAILAALTSLDASQRHRAALRLRDVSRAAVDALIAAALRPENRNHNGTLVYALRFFNCEHLFSELFGLALHGDYEVQCMALEILKDQSFYVTEEQLGTAAKELNELKVRENLPVEGLEALRRELTEVLSRMGHKGVPSESVSV